MATRRNNSTRSTETHKKRSGCQTGRWADGEYWTNGWKASKRFGLVKFSAFTTKKTDSIQSGSGRSWLTNILVKVQKEFEKEQLFSGLMDPNTGKVVIKDLGMVMNPKAPNGGYIGRYGTKK